MNQNQSALNAIKILIMVLASTIVLAGLIFGLLSIVSALGSQGQITDAELVIGAVSGFGVLVMGAGLGGLLTVTTLRSLREKASRAFRLPSVIALSLLFIIILSVGQAFVSFEILLPFLLPPLHVLAALSVPLIMLSLARQTLSETAVTWREMIVMLAGGAFLATSLAIALELLMGGAILIINLLVMSLSSEGMAVLEELGQNLQQPGWIENPLNLASLLGIPAIYMTLAVVFVIIAPFVEELTKPLGAILMSYKHPTPQQIFLWGLAGGAGFALSENIFNTLLGDFTFWAPVFLLRIGATAMHCLASGLVALGWVQFRAGGGYWPFIRAYLISIVLHALWNGSVVGMAGTSFSAMGNTEQTTLAVAGLFIVVILLFILLMSVGFVAAVPILARRLRSAEALLPPPLPAPVFSLEKEIRKEV